MRKMFSRMTAAVLSAVFLVSPLAVAQDDDDGPLSMLNTGNKPFVYVMAASANRLKEEATYMFDVAGMPDALEGILTALDDNVGGLAGVDWERPAGMMMYLNSVFPPAFEVVAFVPVAEMGEFQTLMEMGNSILKEEPSEPGRYELITARRNIQMRVENGYAFIQLPWTDPDPTFDRALPAPATLVGSLSNQFDLGITLDVEAVPKATRSLILNVLTSTMSTQMQQRDDEPDSRYELRRAWSQADIDGLKLFFDDCQKMSVGVNVDSENRSVNLDFVIDVKDGDLLEEILASSSKVSYFSPLLDDEAPISLSWSGIMADRDVQRYTEALEALKAEATRVIGESDELGPAPQEGSPLYMALSAFQETISEGHVDMFGQLYRDVDEKLAVVMALRVADGEAIAGGLGDMLGRVKDIPNIGDLSLNFNEHSNVTFHRLQFDDVDAGGRDLFGKGAGVIAGCAPRTLWICVGGDKSFDVLTSTMDELVSAYENPGQIRQASAMRAIVHVNEMIDMVSSASAANDEERAEKRAAEEKASGVTQNAESRENRFPDERQKRIQQFRERRSRNNDLFREALAEGDDLIELNARPTDNGMRMRARFGEGFVRGLGRVIGSRFIED